MIGSNTRSGRRGLNQVWFSCAPAPSPTQVKLRKINRTQLYGCNRKSEASINQNGLKSNQTRGYCPTHRFYFGKHAPINYGIPVHEWASFIFIIPLMIHIILDWNWVVSVTKRMFGRLPGSAGQSHHRPTHFCDDGAGSVYWCNHFGSCTPSDGDQHNHRSVLGIDAWPHGQPDHAPHRYPSRHALEMDQKRI